MLYYRAEYRSLLKGLSNQEHWISRGNVWNGLPEEGRTFTASARREGSEQYETIQLAWSNDSVNFSGSEELKFSDEETESKSQQPERVLHERDMLLRRKGFGIKFLVEIPLRQESSTVSRSVLGRN